MAGKLVSACLVCVCRCFYAKLWIEWECVVLRGAVRIVRWVGFGLAETGFDCGVTLLGSFCVDGRL